MPGVTAQAARFSVSASKWLSCAASWALRGGVFAGTVLLFLLIAPCHAHAHAPVFPPGGATLATATQVTDPGKSRAFYGRLSAGGDIRYFQMQLSQGERLRLSLLTPDQTSFAPSLAVMGPGLVSEGSSPAFAEIPPGAQVVVVPGRRGAADYEPFTPGAYFFTAELDITAPATGLYHVAVFAQEAGAFSLAMGHREEFTLVEWAQLPFRLPQIYLWEGDGFLLALGPAVLVVLLGLGVVVWRVVATRRKLGLFQWFAVIAGLLYLGTAADVLAQMVQSLLVVGLTGALAVTVVFVVIPIAAGAVILRFGLRETVPSLGARLTLGVLGLVGFGALAGFVGGPVLAVLAAVLPSELAAWGSSRETGAATPKGSEMVPAVSVAAEASDTAATEIADATVASETGESVSESEAVDAADVPAVEVEVPLVAEDSMDAGAPEQAPPALVPLVWPDDAASSSTEFDDDDLRLWSAPTEDGDEASERADDAT